MALLFPPCHLPQKSSAFLPLLARRWSISIQLGPQPIIDPARAKTAKTAKKENPKKAGRFYLGIAHLLCPLLCGPPLGLDLVRSSPCLAAAAAQSPWTPGRRARTTAAARSVRRTSCDLLASHYFKCNLCPIFGDSPVFSPNKCRRLLTPAYGLQPSPKCPKC